LHFNVLADFEDFYADYDLAYGVMTAGRKAILMSQ